MKTADPQRLPGRSRLPALFPVLLLVLLLVVLLGACGGPEPEPFPEEPPDEPAAEPPAETTETSEVPDGAFPPAGEGPSVHEGATPTLRFDGGGKLWAAFEHEGRVHLAVSQDQGQTWSGSVVVHAEPEKIETNGENRPKVAFGREGQVYVSWTLKTEAPFTGEIRFSRSTDGGRTFEAPRTVNDDGLPIGHRFESLAVDALGDVYLVWVDKRDRSAAKQKGEPFRGASIYAAVSTDGGATFNKNFEVAPHACECCRIALAPTPGGGVTAVWRHVFEGEIRDHAMAVLGREGLKGEIRRATEDGWYLEGCPHHGPALAPAEEGPPYLAWFTAAHDQPAAYVRRLGTTPEEDTEPFLFTESPMAHPDVLATEAGAVVVWKQNEEGETRVYASTSEDGGETWGEPRLLAATSGASDHPFLLGYGGQAYLAWHTAKEGLRVLEVG